MQTEVVVLGTFATLSGPGSVSVKSEPSMKPTDTARDPSDPSFRARVQGIMNLIIEGRAVSRV